MDRAWLTLLWILQDISIFIALLIFIVTNRAGRKNFVWIGWMLGVSLLTEILAHIGYWIFRLNMNLLNSLFEFFLVPIYFAFYKSKISSPGTVAALRLMMYAFLIFHFISVVFIRGIHDIHDYSAAFRSVVLMTYALIYFYTLMKDLPTQLVTRLPMFWINASILVYYANMLIISLLAEYIISVLKGDIILTWMVHNFLGIVHYSMLAIGLWGNRSLYTPRSS